MANRAYLYATDRHPAETDAPGADDSRTVGLSEAAFLVPLGFRLLLSGTPRAAPSLIWDGAPVGIVGGYDAGLARLSVFLDRLAASAPRLNQACQDTRAFLSDPANRCTYAVLEAEEIFDMSDAPLDAQVDALLREIRTVDAEAEAFLYAVARGGSYHGDSVDVATYRGEVNALRWAGVGVWSNMLYFDLGGEDHSADAQTVDAFARLTPPAPPTPRPAMPFWTPLVGSMVLVLGVILTGHAPTVPSGAWFFVGFMAVYAVATALCTLAVWGRWWIRRDDRA